MGTAAVEPLVSALQDDYAKSAAAKALGQMGDVRAVEPLVAALKDKRWDVKSAAAKALGQLGTAAVEPLVLALQDKDKGVRHAAAEVLGQIGDTRGVEPLVAALREAALRVDDVERYAAEALGKIGPAAVEPLVVTLQDKDRRVRQAAARALQSLGWQPVNDVQRAWLAVVREDWQEAVSCGPAAVQPLLAALRVREIKWDEMEKVTAALGKLGPVAVQPLVVALQDESKYVRQGAAAALQTLGWQPVNDVQRARLAVARHDWQEAVSCGSAAVQPLLAALRDSNSAWETDNAAAALGKLGPVAVEPLLAALNDSNHRVWSGAVAALGKIGDPRTIMPLAKFAVDKWTKMAEESINSLRRVMESAAAGAAPDDLRAVAQLNNIITIQYQYNVCGNEEGRSRVVVDCSHVRQLARQELIRRGLEVDA